MEPKTYLSLFTHELCFVISYLFFISEVLNAEACLCHALVALRAYLTKANSVESSIGIIMVLRTIWNSV